MRVLAAASAALLGVLTLASCAQTPAAAPVSLSGREATVRHEPTSENYCLTSETARTLAEQGMPVVLGERKECPVTGNCLVELTVTQDARGCKVALRPVHSPGDSRDARWITWRLKQGDGVADISQFEFDEHRGVVIKPNRQGAGNDRGKDFDNSQRGDRGSGPGNADTEFLWHNKKQRERYLCYDVEVRRKGGGKCTTIDPLIANQ